MAVSGAFHGARNCKMCDENVLVKRKCICTLAGNVPRDAVIAAVVVHVEDAYCFFT